ncbi:GntR family transcriptional regulator [Streptomyces sp. NBC_01591]|uniref:GntR family transcriptional regulator n=1 Tax=Streptomyces sp. NBC_01591 TaxID=2975888 RepID=UPI002DD87164|nr:GntR family transcriptional regulator [Streptomyces sp. NBC_01591]WSD67146.1 GntR family transcriptional regulator [Streptomyces sp. NBC_01591]
MAELIRHEINTGHWLAGQRIPSLAVMAGAAGVSVRTASKAAVLLQNAGLLTLHMGEGLFVSPFNPQ